MRGWWGVGGGWSLHAASHVGEVDVSGVSVGGSWEGARGLRYR